MYLAQAGEKAAIGSWLWKWLGKVGRLIFWRHQHSNYQYIFRISKRNFYLSKGVPAHIPYRRNKYVEGLVMIMNRIIKVSIPKNGFTWNEISRGFQQYCKKLSSLSKTEYVRHAKNQHGIKNLIYTCCVNPVRKKDVLNWPTGNQKLVDIKKLPTEKSVNLGGPGMPLGIRICFDKQVPANKEWWSLEFDE